MRIKPDYTFDDIYSVNFEQLKNDGIDVLLFDLDSTVMPSKSAKFPKEVLELFEKLKKDFKLAIVSNVSYFLKQFLRYETFCIR